MGVKFSFTSIFFGMVNPSLSFCAEGTESPVRWTISQSFVLTLPEPVPVGASVGATFGYRLDSANAIATTLAPVGRTCGCDKYSTLLRFVKRDKQWIYLEPVSGLDGHVMIIIGLLNYLQ
jgi:hypothetical protein